MVKSAVAAAAAARTGRNRGGVKIKRNGDVDDDGVAEVEAKEL